MANPRFDPTKYYTTIVDIDGTIYAVQGGVYYDGYGNSFTAPHRNKLGWAGVHTVLVPRTSAQLAAAPAAADLGLGFQALFYASDVTPTSGSPLALYVATATAYVPAGGTGSGGGAVASVNGQTGTVVLSALNVSAIPQSSGNYNATTNTVLTGPFTGQNLVSGTLPTGSGPAAFKVTVGGTPGLDSVGTLGVGDYLFYSSALVWDVDGGAAVTTNLYKGDGTTAQRLLAALPGYDYSPGPLFQTGVPIGVMPSCTIASGGIATITGANTPTAYPAGCWMWYSATALSGSSLAGWYWTVLAGTRGSTATSIQVYNNYMPIVGTAGQQAGTTLGGSIANAYPVQASPTTTGITGGTHTQPTATTIFLPGPTLPANYMGLNGRITAQSALRNNNSANIKQFQAGVFWQAQNPTTATNTGNISTSWNAAATNAQLNLSADIGSAVEGTTANDTTTAIVTNPRMNFAAGGSGNDWQVCENLVINVVPRA